MQGLISAMELIKQMLSRMAHPIGVKFGWSSLQIGDSWTGKHFFTAEYLKFKALSPTLAGGLCEDYRP